MRNCETTSREPLFRSCISSQISLLDKSTRLRETINSYKNDPFFINPNRQKTLGSYSKIGLAFTRIIDYRFHTNSNVFHMNIANLIFALQSFAEGIAENELKKQHRKSKNEIIKSIEKSIQYELFE